MNVLLLGGTTGATELAKALALKGIKATFSYAGRVQALNPQPLPTRVGGFGGVTGLVDYLKAERITHLVDATHPFAAQMSRNAVAASNQTGVQLIALERPPWVPVHGDQWTKVPDETAAVAALPKVPARIFLAIGRRGLAAYRARPEHWYLSRVIEAEGTDFPLPRGTMIEGRPPFSEMGETALLTDHKIELIVAKNSGGTGGRAKLLAARSLGVPVLMIERPVVPTRDSVETPEHVLAWLGHPVDLGV